MIASGARTGVFALLLSIIALAVALYAVIGERTGTYGKVVTEATAFDRVRQTGQLRVGYLIMPPFLQKNTATGELSGVFFDVTEEMGQRLGLDVVWVEEVPLAAVATGLESNRYDLIAFPLWRSASRAKSVAFSEPLFFSTVGAYGRDDDTRFSAGLDALNAPGMVVAGMDGELAIAIAQSDYPQAKIHALPQLSDYTQLLLEVSAGKADATFFNRVQANRFMHQNPGAIKELSDDPVRVYAESYMLPLSDWRFQSMINIAVTEMVQNGVIERALRKYGEDPGEYYRVAVPFRTPG